MLFCRLYPNSPKVCGSFGEKMLCPSSKPLRIYPQNKVQNIEVVQVVLDLFDVYNTCATFQTTLQNINSRTSFIEKIGECESWLIFQILTKI